MNTGKPFNPADLPLRDIHLPEPVSWWPPAPGWWMLFAVVIIALGISWWLYRRWRQRRILRELEAQLDAIKTEYQQHHDGVKTVTQLSVLLRRACISFFPRKDVAGLTGERWLAFLDHISNSLEYSEGAGKLLLDAPYKPAEAIDEKQITPLFNLVGHTLQQAYQQSSIHRGHRT